MSCGSGTWPGICPNCPMKPADQHDENPFYDTDIADVGHLASRTRWLKKGDKDKHTLRPLFFREKAEGYVRTNVFAKKRDLGLDVPDLSLYYLALLVGHVRPDIDGLFENPVDYPRHFAFFFPKGNFTESPAFMPLLPLLRSSRSPSWSPRSWSLISSRSVSLFFCSCASFSVGRPQLPPGRIGGGLIIRHVPAGPFELEGAHGDEPVDRSLANFALLKRLVGNLLEYFKYFATTSGIGTS